MTWTARCLTYDKMKTTAKNDDVECRDTAVVAVAVVCALPGGNKVVGVAVVVDC